MANLAAHNKSAESLSSVYSRSISGEKHSSQHTQGPGALRASSRSYSSSSTATVKKSHLGAMRLAEDPEVIIVSQERPCLSSNSSNCDIDDAATLQARLPSVKAVCGFGEVDDLTSTQHITASLTQLPPHSGETGGMDRLYHAPLNIRKSRSSAAMFKGHIITAVA